MYVEERIVGFPLVDEYFPDGREERYFALQMTENLFFVPFRSVILTLPMTWSFQSCLRVSHDIFHGLWWPYFLFCHEMNITNNIFAFSLKKSHGFKFESRIRATKDRDLGHYFKSKEFQMDKWLDIVSTDCMVRSSDRAFLYPSTLVFVSRRTSLHIFRIHHCVHKMKGSHFQARRSVQKSLLPHCLRASTSLTFSYNEYRYLLRILWAMNWIWRALPRI